MAESHRMTAAQLANELLNEEHADVLREAWPGMAAHQPMEADRNDGDATSTPSRSSSSGACLRS